MRGRRWSTREAGIAGRKVVIDFIDSKLNPNETRNATIQACADDFAMVGGEALFLNNVADMTGCVNAAGQPIGIPDVPGLALDPAQQCSPVSFVDHRPRPVLRDQERSPADVPRPAG